MASVKTAPAASNDGKPALLRQLGLGSAAALVISNMVGTGIFTTSGFLAGDLADVNLFIGIWIVGAVAALAGAFVYSELGINFPSSGGEYVYLTEAYGGAWGFMVGWVSFVAGFSGPIAASALAFSDYLGYFNPALKQSNTLLTLGPAWFQIKIGGAQAAASALVAALTVLNLVGLRPASRVQNALTAIKIAVIASFIVFGFLAGAGNWAHFSQPAVRTSPFPLAAQFAISLFFIYTSYSGWNAATYVAEEIKDPKRTLPLALTCGTILVATLYVLLNFVFLYAAPMEQMKGVIAIGSLAASNLFGSGIGGVFSALMALSLVSTVNAMVIVGPRVYYAMARNGAFFRWAGSVHPKWRTPAAAILCQGACSIVMTLTPFPDLVLFIGVTLGFFAAMAVASIFKFRQRPGWQRLAVVSFAYPLIPLMFVSLAAVTTAVGVWFKPVIVGATAALAAVGAISYHLRRRAA
ncbi:MAG: amino acid permease [Acidobacteria bacterium]|nr:amino acid permease [Acidobacteriota bacterium]